MTTQQFEQAAVLIEKINRHKTNLEDLENVLYNTKCPVDMEIYNHADVAVAFIPKEIFRQVLQSMIKFHEDELKNLEQQLDKI